MLAILMHASYIFSTLFVLALSTTGVPFLIYSGVFAAALMCGLRLGVGSLDAAPSALSKVRSGANRRLCQNCVRCLPKPRSNTVDYRRMRTRTVVEGSA
jgi:hypothetical protein